MTISSFDDLLLAACQQAQGQRLLLVFAAAELPDDASPEQRAGFAQGAGGALVPAMCVDKTPEEIGNFERLKQGLASLMHPGASCSPAACLAGAMRRLTAQRQSPRSKAWWMPSSWEHLPT